MPLLWFAWISIRTNFFIMVTIGCLMLNVSKCWFLYVLIVVIIPV